MTFSPFSDRGSNYPSDLQGLVTSLSTLTRSMSSPTDSNDQHLTYIGVRPYSGTLLSPSITSPPHLGNIPTTDYMQTYSRSTPHLVVRTSTSLTPSPSILSPTSSSRPQRDGNGRISSTSWVEEPRNGSSKSQGGKIAGYPAAGMNVGESVEENRERNDTTGNGLREQLMSFSSQDRWQAQDGSHEESKDEGKRKGSKGSRDQEVPMINNHDDRENPRQGGRRGVRADRTGHGESLQSAKNIGYESYIVHDGKDPSLLARADCPQGTEGQDHVEDNESNTQNNGVTWGNMHSERRKRLVRDYNGRVAACRGSEEAGGWESGSEEKGDRGETGRAETERGRYMYDGTGREVEENDILVEEFIECGGKGKGKGKRDRKREDKGGLRNGGEWGTQRVDIYKWTSVEWDECDDERRGLCRDRDEDGEEDIDGEGEGEEGEDEDVLHEEDWDDEANLSKYTEVR